MTRLAPDRTAVDASNFFTPALTSAGLPKSGPDPERSLPATIGPLSTLFTPLRRSP